MLEAFPRESLHPEMKSALTPTAVLSDILTHVYVIVRPLLIHLR